MSSIFRLSDFPRFSEDLVEAYLHDQEIELVDSVLCGGVVTRLVKGGFSPSLFRFFYTVKVAQRRISQDLARHINKVIHFHIS